jgi:hypothetical protein
MLFGSAAGRRVEKGSCLRAELLQFGAFVGVFAVVAVLWLYIVYLPGRTLERWEDQRPRRREDGRPGGRP